MEREEREEREGERWVFECGSWDLPAKLRLKSTAVVHIDMWWNSQNLRGEVEFPQSR